MYKLNVQFNTYKTFPIALYGIGAETEKVLEEMDSEFNIIGLLDGFKESGTIYGKHIISLDKVIDYNIKLIIVVARPGSCRAIKKRIEGVCRANNIALFDIRGNDLLKDKKAIYRFENIQGITKKALSETIDKYDIISIDLFDTLIMRYVLYNTDIHNIVYEKLKSNGYIINDFCEKRIESEKYLTRASIPTLVQIYQYMIDKYDIEDISAEQMAEIEYQADYDTIIPRKEMCEIISEKYNSGKQIYIVTDTYYNKNQIKAILKKCNIDFYTDIFISCEYGTDKGRHLFDELKSKTGNKKCLHIGDDYNADIEGAKRNGMHTCHIYSSLELFDKLGYLGLENDIENYSDRLKLGMFISSLLNSPFQFENDDRKISLFNSYDIGYLLFAPLITDFMIWFNSKIKEYNAVNVWFAARDGFLIKQLFEQLNNDVKAQYFLTSRTAVIRAGLQNDEDIKYVSDMRFSGTLQNQLSERFGLDIKAKDDESLFDYKQQIFEKSKISRENYKKYINSINNNNDEIIFFDFVSKGTCQMYADRMIQNHIRGLYFLQLDKEYMKDKCLDIVSFYSENEKDNSAIFNEYYILETVLTSPQPSVKEFDKDGKPIFTMETRTENNIQCVLDMQKGIVDYFKTYIGLFVSDEPCINKSIDEKLLLMIHKFNIESNDFKNMKVEDPFFNRQTDICDLI